MTDSKYLESTKFIDASHPSIRELATSLAGRTPTETAIALFDWVRDNIRYDPYTAMDPPEMYQASTVLDRKRGYCVMKAVLLAALCRAVGIPSRLAFADVRNHKSPAKMLELMGTNLFIYHGFVEFELDGRWVKATPAFDAGTSKKIGVLPVNLDGANDAMLHPVDPEGHPFIEYIRDRGSHADLPLEELRRTIAEAYPKMNSKSE